MSLRFAAVAGVLLAVAAALVGTFTWFWNEANTQSANFDGLVLPALGAVLAPSLIGIGLFTVATTLVTSAAGTKRSVVLLFGLSASIATAYGIFGSSLYDGAPPYIAGTIFKAFGIVILSLMASMARSRLLAAGLLFGALGDALLAWSHDAFLFGALAFLVGHLCYITLFVRNGIGVRAALRDPTRLVLLAVTVLAALVASRLTPHDSPMFMPLSVYSGVLTLMVLSSYTLPWTRWVAMAGAVLFLISDGFVAWNMFHHDADPTLAFWRSFAGWMIYWAGQAGLCFGALALRRTPA